MKNFRLFIFLLLCFLPIFAYSQKKNQTPRSEISNPAKFQFLTINGKAAAEAAKPCTAVLEECGNERLVLYGYEGLGGPDPDNPKTETFTFKSGKKTVGIFLLTILDNEDDSVAGERVRLAFEKKGNVWHFVQAGRQFKCMRGANTKIWTKNLCP